MSYCVQIWKQPGGLALPATMKDVVQCVDELSRTEKSCPEFKVLARQLTERYPCICSEEMRDVSEDEWAWSEGPLDGESDTQVYGLGLNSDRLDEVLPFVISTAVHLGLNVLDEQNGQCFLADGSVIEV